MKYLVNNVKTNWYDFISEETKKDYFLAIDDFLFKHQNSNIYPKQQDIFKAYNYFNIEETKIVIFGQDPYHNPDQANGLAFSVNNGIKLPPSLKNIFKKLSIDKHLTRTNGELSDWASQGMLLLNITLTVFQNQPNSHYHLNWKQFIINTINQLNQNTNPILFLFFGNYAKHLIPYVNQDKHKVLLWPHPSPLAAIRCHFFDNNLFDKIDDFMLNHYHKKIRWI